MLGLFLLMKRLGAPYSLCERGTGPQSRCWTERRMGCYALCVMRRREADGPGTCFGAEQRVGRCFRLFATMLATSAVCMDLEWG